MRNGKRPAPRFALALLCVAGLAGTSIAIAQNRWAYPMSMHPIGSEIVDRIAPSEMNGMLNYMSADARGAILPTSKDQASVTVFGCRSRTRSRRSRDPIPANSPACSRRADTLQSHSRRWR